MKFIYENDRGKIVMQGGGAEVFNIIEIRGLSLPESDINSVYYPNMAGCVVESVTPQERAITISADARDAKGSNILRAMNVFSTPGTITITSGGKTRKISARCTSFEQNKRRGAFVPFAVQFMADDPYFTDMYETKTVISKRENLIKAKFTMPCVLSVRRNEAQLINKGDAPAEPTFTLTSLGGALCPCGIVIENLRTNDKIKLNTDIAAGEKIVVDIKNRRITSSSRGNIIACLDDETSISAFSLDLGVSDVKIFAEDIEGELYAECSFNNSYICACV